MTENNQHSDVNNPNIEQTTRGASTRPAKSDEPSEVDKLVELGELDESQHSGELDDLGELEQQLRATAQEMREQMRPSSEVLAKTIAAAQQAQAEQPKAFPPPSGLPATPAHVRARNRRLSRILGVAAAAVLVVGCFGVYNAIDRFDSQTQGTVASQEIITPSSYDQIYASLEERLYSTVGNELYDTGATMAPQARSEESAESLSMSAGAQDSVYSTEDAPMGTAEYSGTNLQVEGVDEADIVKTDGTSIFILSEGEVAIMSAEGRDSKELARINSVPGYPQDMYLSGSRLVIMSQAEGWQGIYDDASLSDSSSPSSDSSSSAKTMTSSSYYGGYYSQTSVASIYDISNPADPLLLNSFAQDGGLRSSRLVEGMLYMVSVHSVYGDGCVPEDPQTYVPNMYEGFDGEEDLRDFARPLDVEDIRIMPEYTSTQFTVLTAIDVLHAKRSNEHSILGDTSTIYMNEDNLFLTNTNYEYLESTPVHEESVTLQQGRIPILPWEIISYLINPDAWIKSTTQQNIDPTSWGYSYTTTRITRVALNKGNPELAASTTIDGQLLNQFSLDEYEGHLRVALTVTKPASDPMGAQSSQQWVETLTTNSLLIFDSNLMLVGSIEDLAPGEQIYSARLSGEVGYVVTYRQVDPLFSIDLSDPRNPKVMDALKIPGFSQYLHTYADGLLLGLGTDANNAGFQTGYLKLSMFDVSNPFALDEANKQMIDALTSDALYNHKALLIDTKHNLIGFSVGRDGSSQSSNPESPDDSSASSLLYAWESYYMLYGYDALTGFYERAAIKLPNEYEQARALYIDGYLYVVNGDSVGLFSLDTLEEIIWFRM